LARRSRVAISGRARVRVTLSSTPVAFHTSLEPILRWRLRIRLLPVERLSHLRNRCGPRRARPTADVERSSTRPPQYRASVRLTNLTRVADSLQIAGDDFVVTCARSGPAISTMALRGAASATSATMHQRRPPRWAGTGHAGEKPDHVQAGPHL